jgi:hypothetical protein
VAITRLSTKRSGLRFECTPPASERAACFPGYSQVLADEAGTDVGEFYRGFITLTPMAIDVTDTKAQAGLRVLERR